MTVLAALHYLSIWLEVTWRRIPLRIRRLVVHDLVVVAAVFATTLLGAGHLDGDALALAISAAAATAKVAVRAAVPVPPKA